MPEQTRHIFLDPTGSRAKRLRVGAGLVAVLAVGLLIAFVISVLTAPHLSLFGPEAGPQPVRSHPSAARLAAARKVLFDRIRTDRRHMPPAPMPAAAQIRGAYFAPWRDTGMDSFRNHAADLTHIYPAWLSITQDGRGLNTDFWRPEKSTTTKDLVQIANANGVRIVPVVGNAETGKFDADRLRRMLSNPAASAAVAKQLADFVRQNNYAGLQVDFEQLDAKLAAQLAPWLTDLAARMHAQRSEISITIETDLDPAAVKALAQPVDYAVLMAYDEHGSFSTPGAIASATYTEDALRQFTPVIGTQKLVLGIGVYGYDWNIPESSTDTITNQQAVALAVRYRGHDDPKDAVDFDDVALEPTFQYNDDKGQLHEVWFLDAVTAHNALTLARNYNVRGGALWALGMEDPSVWQTFGRRASPNPDLRKVVVPQQVDFIGDGELLRVVRRPQAGARFYDVDPTNGLITDETYTAYPSGWLVERSGAPDKTVALTFDDGPDPTWTPAILDLLKRRGVKATFFMIGQQVADYPAIVRRVYAEGHEIGSHSFTHPNMAHVGEERVRLELSATQRAFEAVLGRSVVLFRPPYNADSEPRSYGEIMPIAVAYDQGYVTAGETIDPNDWDIFRKQADGTTRRTTGDDIRTSVLAQLNKGQAILLHDGGGDRSATLASLDGLITELQKRGYRFSTIGELEGRGRAQTMPAIPAADRSLVEVGAVGFFLMRLANGILFWGFTIAIALGLARIALMIGLAARPNRAKVPAAGELRVDVLVAAYNEATVITRTVNSLLACRGVDQKIIVVDDGSTDGTGDVVEQAFAHEPRVVLARKPNGGKASALNVALALSDAPVVVGVDADTQLDPDALMRLVRWFADDKIGAVAGNVKVGNRTKLVTRWQSLEYITSQNVDRRAMSRLNAITVVPGAIGAYRASALREVGGYRSDTLAEDMDLTWRLRRAGWTLVNESQAYAFTEAPETLGALMKQRFRWSFGTLQCLWKHRGALFRYGWFGKLALPTLWLFQFGAQILAPFVDLQLLVAALARFSAWLSSLEHPDTPMSPDPMLWLVVTIYVAFLGLELAAGFIAYAFDREDKRELWLLPTQRFVYRQIMYLVVWRSLLRAMGGTGQAWGKLKRTGAVQAGISLPEPEPVVKSPAPRKAAKKAAAMVERSDA
jgi:cellulose synthase/poly-beta-1,6-N-acetylglucosamine synthase-like glycosyltransferase/peptidoglycan/xylan/chitin deacetylase (PgdA/CDA1 family)/spore germination protein YaaH